MFLVSAAALVAASPLAGADPGFVDVPAGHLFASEIAWLEGQGITRGCNPPGNDHFCPDDPVTRGQMAAFLVRALDLTASGDMHFVDDDGSVFQGDIERLAAAGITRGCNPPANDHFCPNDPVTRGQMAAFLSRALRLADREGDPFNDDDRSVFQADIERLATAGITRSCNPPANDHFCPNDPVTRGQMAAFLFRAFGGGTAPAPAIIPEARRIDWNPGIPGGIPDDPVTVTVSDFGAAGNGTADDTAAFAAAFDALPIGGGVVYAPAGTYRLTSTLELGDGQVLRGAGADATSLRFDLGGSSDPAIEMVTYERGDWVAISAGFAKGSTTLTLADASGITAPTFAEIQQANDPTVMYTEPEWEADWAESSVGEMVRVVAVEGNTVTLAEPLHHSYRADLDPVFRTQGLVERAGVERLHLERLDGGDGDAIAMKNAAYTWVREVESEMTVRAHVGVSAVYGCEIRDSYFHHSHDYGGGGHGYGTSLGNHVTNCLVENNVFASLRHSMIIQVGANGNVFGYNFSRDSHDDSGNLLPDISLHGHFPFMNLFEGNIVEEIGISDYWGPVGPGNTLLRNCVEVEGVFVRDSSHRQNLVGNVLHGSPDTIQVDGSVEGTLAHGNFEAGTMVWDPDITVRVIPDSSYLEGAPAFYGAMPWPSTGADHPASCTNPARVRWGDGDPIP